MAELSGVTVEVLKAVTKRAEKAEAELEIALHTAPRAVAILNQLREKLRARASSEPGTVKARAVLDWLDQQETQG